jgi:glycosyltransferase EpsF
LFEGFPVTLVEAQASGVNCVISDVISDEVDLGLDLIQFVSLECSDSVWVEQIINSLKKTSCSYQICREALSDHGFNIYRNIELFYETYGV